MTNTTAPLTPFDFGLAWWRGGIELLTTMRRVGEAASAAGEVIDSRTRTMAQAARDPLGGDYRELGRMVPEKVEALTLAGLAAFTDLAALQRDLLQGWHHAMLPLAAGRLPTAGETAQAWARSSHMMERAAGAGGRGFAPLYRAVTGNARRLKRGKRG